MQDLRPDRLPQHAMPVPLPPAALSERLIVFRPAGPSLSWQDLVPVLDRITDGARLRRGVLVDLAAITAVSDTTAALLHDLACRAAGMADLAIAAPAPALGARLERLGLTAILPLFPDRASALASPVLRPHTLCHARAVILAAGKGSRAQPLTGLTPKPLLKVLGRPILDWMIDHLASFGLHRLAVNTGHLASRLAAHLATADAALDIRVQRERRQRAGRLEDGPVGSATTLARLAREGWIDRPVIVTCGDTLADIDLAGMMMRHVERGHAVTIAAMEVPRARVARYGILATDGDGTVHRFQEKPRPDEAVSRLANMGIYIFSPEALAHLPPEEGRDIGNHLLPSLLAHGARIGVWHHRGGWREVGTPADLHAVNMAAARGEAPLARLPALMRDERIHVGNGVRFGPRVRLEGPVFIGDGVEIGGNCRITGPAVIERGARMGPGSRVENALILERATLPARAQCIGTLVLPPGLGTMATGNRPARQQASAIALPVANACKDAAHPRPACR